ncbi:hypothetical protein D9M71_555050 [compost metagenome]
MHSFFAAIALDQAELLDLAGGCAWQRVTLLQHRLGGLETCQVSMAMTDQGVAID